MYETGLCAMGHKDRMRSIRMGALQKAPKNKGRVAEWKFCDAPFSAAGTGKDCKSAPEMWKTSAFQAHFHRLINMISKFIAAYRVKPIIFIHT